jgi:hypothetical protein
MDSQEDVPFFETIFLAGSIFKKKSLRIGFMSLTVKKFIKRKEKEYEKDKKLKKEILIEDNAGVLCCVIRDAWVFVEKSDVPGQVLCLERLKITTKCEAKCRTKLKEGGYVYRPGFFVIGKKLRPVSKITRVEDEFVWEGHAPLVLQEDFHRVVRKAIKSGLIKPQFLLSPP